MLAAGILYGQNFRYDPEDWYIITYPGKITAFTEDNFKVFIATENGIYSFDKVSEDIHYNYELSSPFQNSEVRHFYIDPFRDYYWVITRNEIRYKAAVSYQWRDMSLQNTGIFTPYEIDDIGASPEFIWLRMGEDKIPFHPFNALPVSWNEAEQEKDQIQWGNSYFGYSGDRIDLFWYSIEEEWNMSLGQLLPNGNMGHIISKNDGVELLTTVSFKDSEGNVWVGTDGGYILKGGNFSSRLQIFPFSTGLPHITLSHVDKLGNTWFADSEFKRLGELSPVEKGVFSTSSPFLSRWEESENHWKHYYTSESNFIKSRGINAMHSVGSELYLGTMYGLVILDIFEEEWNLISTLSGLSDEAIWDIVEWDESLYLATARGINEISIKNNKIITFENSGYSPLSNQNIFDLEMDSTGLYIASESGLYKMDWEEDALSLLSNRVFKTVSLEEEGISGNDGQLILLREELEHIYQHQITTYNFCDNFLWSSLGMSLTLTDTITNRSWEYGEKDGIPGYTVYDIQCEDNWVQFLTNNGITFYHWKKYHEN